MMTLSGPLPPIDDVLKGEFGFESFLPGQRDLIQAVLAGRDALGVLPTGGGKSLTYQLPASVLNGLTVVASPLIALMKDQVDAFNRRHRAQAVALHSNLSSVEVSAALAQVSRGVALLYVAPERLELSGYRERIFGLAPKLFVVDEAHCVSRWGYDFRPSYLSLRGTIAGLRPCPVLALTATATPDTRVDIAHRLGLVEPLTMVAPFDRPNLRFEVQTCGPGDKMRRLYGLLGEPTDGGSPPRSRESGIIYVGRRRDADEIAEDLRRNGFKAVAYHAGMRAEDRKAAQEAWLSGEKPIAVATVAFGMGIDNPDVRAVIHYQHPASLEAYYQEAGRAGRDGAPARCVMLFSRKDVSLAHYFIRNRYPNREQVLAVLEAVSAAGTPAEELRAGAGGMTDEQFNVALLVLLEQGLIRREEGDRLTREKDGAAGSRLNLDTMYARKVADYARLKSVISYAEDRLCHRAGLLRYFGEKLPPGYRCGNCSACAGGKAPIHRTDTPTETSRILERHREVLESKGRLGATMFARFLGGSSSKRIPPAWRNLAGFGALSHFPIKVLRSLSAKVLGENAHRRSRVGAGKVARIVRPAEKRGGAGATARATVHAVDLEKRTVPRKIGVSILRLVETVSGSLAPSGIAGVLQGSRTCDAVHAHPDLLRSELFGVLKGTTYEEVMADVLSMRAKGYLCDAPGSGRKLMLTPKGTEVLEERREAVNIPRRRHLVENGG
ncbi:MAG: RecQ family ATP-dependent DNA helicase [Nitrospirae bacterium]|nr:RecQ family ATP-dependent DNA helicase [Nitrospirota bacterium]